MAICLFTMLSCSAFVVFPRVLDQDLITEDWQFGGMVMAYAYQFSYSLSSQVDTDMDDCNI